MNSILRHLLATIAYRFSKVIENVHPQFGTFSLGKGVRTPNEIINHMTSVLLFVKSIVADHDRSALAEIEFIHECQRFYQALSDIDSLLEFTSVSEQETYRIIQGPLSDVLTHIGQIATLRRCFGDPIIKENFSIAPVKTGKMKY